MDYIDNKNDSPKFLIKQVKMCRKGPSKTLTLICVTCFIISTIACCVFLPFFYYQMGLLKNDHYTLIQHLKAKHHERQQVINFLHNKIREFQEELGESTPVKLNIRRRYKRSTYDRPKSLYEYRKKVMCPVCKEGPHGPKGPAGRDGIPGKNGYDGSPGKPGKQGLDGKPGPSGQDGRPGHPGGPGADGRPGRDGKPGIPGLPGLDGITGKDGDPGRDILEPGPEGKPGNPGQDGPKGNSGLDGKPGSKGIDGKSGTSGSPGYQGLPGNPGKDGDPGPDGLPGKDGDPGRDGDSGKDGIPGKPGPKGPPGLIGIDGKIGPPGDPGKDGLLGRNGEPGKDGRPGETGNPGQVGDSGKTVNGRDGIPGKDGLPGRDGIPGREGEPAPPGENGDRGPAGRDGSEGSPGKNGLDGLPGRDGHPGKDGFSIRYPGPPGIPGPPGKDGSNGNHGEPGLDGLPGKDGKPGKEGETGPPGEQGLQGFRGSVGRNGKPGRIGNTGPSGDKGSKGPEGPKGIPGKDGVPGTDGRSGDRGPQGDAGTDGTPGIDGKSGEKGLMGIPGKLGHRGAPGKDGDNGKSGNPGRPGKNDKCDCSIPEISGDGSTTYVRYGRSECPSNTGAELIYTGYVASGHFFYTGSGGDYLCLPKEMQYNKYSDEFDSKSKICGSIFKFGRGENHPFRINWQADALHQTTISSSNSNSNKMPSNDDIEMTTTGIKVKKSTKKEKKIISKEIKDSDDTSILEVRSLKDKDKIERTIREPSLLDLVKDLIDPDLQPSTFKTNPNSSKQAERSAADYQTYEIPSSQPQPPYHEKIPGDPLSGLTALCSVCYIATRNTNIMIPGDSRCPEGWTREYYGYLMAANYKQARTAYICMDEEPEGEYIPDNTKVGGSTLYLVESQCGNLPCRKYPNGYEMPCAVCTR